MLATFHCASPPLFLCVTIGWSRTQRRAKRWPIRTVVVFLHESLHARFLQKFFLARWCSPIFCWCHLDAKDAEIDSSRLRLWTCTTASTGTGVFTVPTRQCTSSSNFLSTRRRQKNCGVAIDRKCKKSLNYAALCSLL